MSQSKKKSSQAKFRSAPKSQRRSASKPVARRVKARSSSSNDAELRRTNGRWLTMIKHVHIEDLDSTPPPPLGTDEGSVSVNPLPAVNEEGLRFLRELYQQAFGFEEIAFNICDDPRPYIYSEGGQSGRAEIVLDIREPRQALLIKTLLDFAAHLARTSTEFTR
jgi:hypothetical protein